MSQPAFIGGPAFPNFTPDMPVVVSPGMTLRDWFAGMAMIGLLYRGYGKWDALAKDAGAIADAMLIEKRG